MTNVARTARSLRGSARVTPPARRVVRLLAPLCALPLVLSLVAAGGCVNQLGPGAREVDADHDVAFVAQDDALQAQLIIDEDGVLATPVLQRESPFNRIALRFDAAGAVVVEGRARGADGWSAWAPMSSTWDDDEAGAHNAHVDVAGGSTAAQLRFVAAAGVVITHLVVETFDFFPDAADADLAIDADPAAHDVEQGLAADGIAVTRAQWGARPRSCGPRHTPQRLTIHHTDTPNNDSMSMPARLRQIQNFHINSRGWCDIGYHFLIGQDGKVYQGRVENVLGSHAANANTNNVGISFIGTFSERAPSDAMMSAAARIMRSMARTWGFALDRERVKGHRQIGSTGTSCPGNALYNRIDDLIARARSASGAAPTPATDTPPPATTCSLIRADASSLNIRPEPSTSRAPVGSLEGGQTATRLETVTGQNIDGVTRWYRIDHQGTVGFVSGAFASCAD